MLHTSLKLIQRMPLCVILLALSFTGRAATATEPYRMLSPTGAAPHPAVLLVPGCSGFTVTNGVDQYNGRAAELQAAGYAVVFVDYVGRRMQNNCAHVSLAEVSSDILEAATLARDQSDVDMTRISVIGWSYGGGGILAALKAMPPGSPVFTKAVMYYPVCRGAPEWSTSVAGLMLLGGKDDISNPALCDAVVKGVAPEKLRTITYPNVRHGFDMRGFPERADQPPGTPGYSAEADKAAWTVVLDS